MAGDFSTLAQKVAFLLSVAPWHNKFVDLLREAINQLSKKIDPDLLEQAHFLPEDGIDISEAGNTMPLCSTIYLKNRGALYLPFTA